MFLFQINSVTADLGQPLTSSNPTLCSSLQCSTSYAVSSFGLRKPGHSILIRWKKSPVPPLSLTPRHECLPSCCPKPLLFITLFCVSVSITIHVSPCLPAVPMIHEGDCPPSVLGSCACWPMEMAQGRRWVNHLSTQDRSTACIVPLLIGHAETSGVLSLHTWNHWFEARGKVHSAQP